ncbi:hypothetical protein ACLK1U_07795 [Escherichia coli]
MLRNRARRLDYRIMR